MNRPQLSGRRSAFSASTLLVLALAVSPVASAQQPREKPAAQPHPLLAMLQSELEL